MKPRQWLPWAKWALVGCSILAIVMTAAFGTANAPRTKAGPSAGPDAARMRNVSQRSPEESHVELERLHRPAPQKNEEGEIGNVFGVTSWYVPPPPPPPVKPPPPPPPTAPPMPFSYLGLYEDAPKKVIMLVKGDRVYTVSEGDVIENTYRVDQVSPGTVEMTYLPLNIKQSINTGNPS